MRFLIGVVGALVGLAVLRLVASASGDANDVAVLSWMAGSWAGEEGKVQMEEHWTVPKGGMLLGLHRDVASERTVSFEFLRIEKTSDGIVYFAQPKGAPPTPFRLVECKEKRVVFENPQHDFPQRILYWHRGRGGSRMLQT